MVFLNNIRPFRDPFTHFLMSRVPNAIPTGKMDPDETEKLRAQRKNLLLLSYEDVNIRKLGRADLLPQRDTWLGPSGRIQRILLLRDFYNWMASRLRLLEKKVIAASDIPAKVAVQISLWIMYAREFAGETDWLGGPDTVRIRFDRWSEDDEYRLSVLRRLGIDALNNSRFVVPPAGGGSSFDGTRYSGTAEAMELMNRWQYLLEPEHRAIVELLQEQRAVLEHYNRQIFGSGCPFGS